MTDQQRYQLHCFVCDGGCTESVDLKGWMTPAQIAAHRPWNCWYAVVVTSTGTAEVWDMDAVIHRIGLSEPCNGCVIGVYDDPDRAAMATALGVGT